MSSKIKILTREDYERLKEDVKEDYFLAGLFGGMFMVGLLGLCGIYGMQEIREMAKFSIIIITIISFWAMIILWWIKR